MDKAAVFTRAMQLVPFNWFKMVLDRSSDEFVKKGYYLGGVLKFFPVVLKKG